MVLYLSNSTCQPASSSGGKIPVSGFHSTIESPDSVSRVAPPTTKVTNISAATVSSHKRMARRRVARLGGVSIMHHIACARRRQPYRGVSSR